MTPHDHLKQAAEQVGVSFELVSAIAETESPGITIEQRAALWRKFPALLDAAVTAEQVRTSLPAFIVVVTGGHPDAATIARIEDKLQAVGLAGGVTVCMTGRQREHLGASEMLELERMARQVGELRGENSLLVMRDHFSEWEPPKPRPAAPFWSADYRNKRGRR